MALGGSSGIATRLVSPENVRAMLKDGGEMALLDMREEGVFSEQGHPFFANSVPLSRLELMVRDLVPRMLTRIVVYDGGDEDLAERAAAKLTRMGYRDVAMMAGGTRGWAAAGMSCSPASTCQAKPSASSLSIAAARRISPPPN